MSASEWEKAQRKRTGESAAFHHERRMPIINEVYDILYTQAMRTGGK